MDTRKPEKCVHKSSNCMAGADSRLPALLGGGHEHDRNCLRLRFRRWLGPSLVRTFPASYDDPSALAGRTPETGFGG